jgi:hypothetical protein
LALDFVGARRGPQYYKSGGVTVSDITQIPGWTYTGGTPAGTGSYAPKADGSLQFFPSVTNLLLQSQTFGTTWATARASVSSDATTAPDGTTTADKLVEDSTASNSHTLTQTVTTTAASYTYSVYLKADTRTFAMLYHDQSNSAVAINLTTGVVAGNAGLGAPISSSVTAIGNGWYRAAMTITATAATNTFRIYLMTDATTYSYTGNGTSGIYIYGAQLELGSTASTYIPTTTAAVTVAPPRITDAGYLPEEARTNLLLRSQEFDNASWTKTATTVTANQAVAPDGTLTADALAETATTAQHVISQFVSKAASPVTYTATWYVKQFGTARNAKLSLTDSAGAGADYIVNPVTGATLSGPTYYGGVPFSSASVVVTQVANGFTRIDMTATSNSGVYITSVLQPASGTTLNYLGDTGTGFYIWQADLQAGSFATSPIPTTSVAVTRAADVGYVNAFSAPTDGTILVTGSAASYSASGGVPILVGGDVVGANSIFGQSGNGNHFNGTAAIGGTGTFSLYPAVNSLALAYVGTASRSLSTNGSAVTTSATTKGPFNRVMVGGIASGTGLQMPNAPIRRIVIYPRAMSNAELQAITTAGAY